MAIPPADKPERVKLPENVLSPLKMLLSESSVDEAAVMVSVPPKLTDVPLSVNDEFANIVLVMEPAGNETDEVAVRVPTVKFPTDELDTIEPADSKSGDEVAL